MKDILLAVTHCARRSSGSGLRLSFAALSVLAAAPALAQTTTGAGASGEAQSIDEVMVSGKRIEQSLPQDLAEYGNRVQVIEAEDLERRGITDIAQALQTMAPSLFIQQKSGAFDYVNVSLQGSRSNEILWLVDGVRITNRLYNGTSPLDTIPASMVERIEVLEGGQGLFYGTQAVAGVVNIITKTFSREASGQVDFGADTNDGRHVSGYARGAAGMHEFVFYASSDAADGFQPFRDQDYQPSATDRERGYDVQTLGAKYGVDIGDDVRVSAGYQHTNAQLDYAAPARVSRYYNKREEGIANLKIDWAVSDNLGLYVKAYHHKWDTLLYRYENSLTTPGTLITLRDGVFWGYEDYGINALAKFVPHAGRIEYYLGYDFQNYNGRDESLLIADQTEKVHAVFGQVRINVSEQLKLAAGARYNKPTEGDPVSVWNVSGSYNILDNLFVRTNIGTAYRLPDAGQLFGIDPCCTQGNPKLSGERSQNINLSVGGAIDIGANAMSWEVIGFKRKLKDLIGEADDGTGTGTLVYVNTDATTDVTGWQVVFAIPLSDSLGVNLSYTATDATVGGSSNQIDRVPEDLAKAVFDYHPSGLPFGASLSWNHAGNTYQTLSGGIGRQNYGSSDPIDVSGYVQFGNAGKHRLTARVQNVTDEVYTSNMERFRTDVGNVSYAARSLGVPRTYTLMYGYSF